MTDLSPLDRQIVPLNLADANDHVRRIHRHSPPVVGAKFCIGLAEGDEIIGVAIVGRPVARHFDDGWTLEVNRVCTEGARNACSQLYGAAWRATKALGYRRLITYTLATESGSSLRGAGWRVVAERQARHGWDAPSRPRVRDEASPIRTLWEAV